jgi:hypothetical protein
MLMAIAATGPLLRYRSLGQMLGDSQAIAVWGEVAFVAILLATLWSAAMIARDGHRPPWKLILLPLLVCLVCGMIWPELYAIPANSMLPNVDRLRSFPTPLTGPFGALVGAASVSLWSAIAERHARYSPKDPCPTSWAIAWAAVAGLFIGWQMTLIAAAIAAAMMILALVATIRRPPSDKSTRVAWLSRFTLAVSLVVLQRNGWPSLAQARPLAWILAAISVILFGAVLTALVAKAKSPQSSR